MFLIIILSCVLLLFGGVGLLVFQIIYGFILVLFIGMCSCFIGSFIFIAAIFNDIQRDKFIERNSKEFMVLRNTISNK